MGGDAAVALAGIDDRISRVGAIVATPDWTRPGMRTLGEHPELIDQGQADAYARWFFHALDPMTHLKAYERHVAIRFLCAGEDQHVLPEGALRFRADLIASSVDGPTEWGEFDWRGRHTDGSPFEMRGVIIATVRDGLIAAARLYMEPVDSSGEDIAAAVDKLYRPPGTTA